LVERDILIGHLAPGARLGIVDLVERYDIGATPLREGLSRLVSRGLIVGIGQRERTGNEFREGAEEFDRLHKGFHTALLGACGSKRMLAAHSDLYDQAYRYRRAMMRQIDSGKKFVRAHQLLADCVLSRDISGAQAMLSEHLHSTINVVYPPGGN
jgi:GntR family carbon starvation induced transcriptional regulator